MKRAEYLSVGRMGTKTWRAVHHRLDRYSWSHWIRCEGPARAYIRAADSLDEWIGHVQIPRE
jgi:hypothetical protein